MRDFNVYLTELWICQKKNAPNWFLPFSLLFGPAHLMLLWIYHARISQQSINDARLQRNDRKQSNGIGLKAVNRRKLTLIHRRRGL